MSKKPSEQESDLRDQLAGQALVGLCFGCSTQEGVANLRIVVGAPLPKQSGHRWLATHAYKMADAMLKARSKA